MENVNQLYMDNLTGVLTRQGFIHEVEEYLARKDSSVKYAIIVFDIVNFKSINEIFGHSAGDKLLTYLCERLKANKYHILTIGRLEADWFAILVDQEKIKLDAISRDSIQEWAYEGRKVQYTIRFGAYLIEDLSVPINIMVDRAVVAMHHALKSDHLNYAIFDEKMHQDYVSTAEVLAGFREGLRQKEFVVYYQPIIQTATKKIVAAEALVRWQHPTLGFILPGQFIPVLESNGLITELDRYMMEEAFRFIDTAGEENLPVSTIAMNLSWQDFYDQSMIDEIIQLAKKNNKNNRGVNFEVTETSLSGLKQDCDYTLAQIRACGSRILLDDFGSGVSSFAMIGSYPFDIVKIDRSFIRQIESSDKIRSIIKSIITMCHDIGLKVVGEGVETRQEADFLEDAQCDYQQGFFFAKPMPEAEFTQLLRSQLPVDPDDKEMQRNMAKITQPTLNADFFKKVLDKMDAVLIVVDTSDHSVIYMNDTAIKFTGFENRPYQGIKCYSNMGDLGVPCSHCTMDKLKVGETMRFTISSGEQLTDVDTFLWEVNGKRVFVEIGSVSAPKNAARDDYIQQIGDVLNSLPNQQCITHVDVTADQWISTSGRSPEIEKLQDADGVDVLIQRISSFAVTEEEKKKFTELFSRSALLEKYETGTFQYGHNFDFWSAGAEHHTRTNAHLLYNPDTQHVECFIYVVDITAENLSKELQSAHQHDLETLLEQAEHDRRFDYLTTLRNRLDLNDEFQRIDGDDSAIVDSVWMFDIDDFKAINDRYGHIVGDQCLHELGTKISRYGEEHHINFYRYGGEEFLGLAEGCTLTPSQIANDILDIARGITITTEHGQTLTFSVSVGYSMGKNEIRRMVDFADKAMYIAKRKGKNCFTEYEE